jgi:hypothetical protein
VPAFGFLVLLGFAEIGQLGLIFKQAFRDASLNVPNYILPDGIRDIEPERTSSSCSWRAADCNLHRA